MPRRVEDYRGLTQMSRLKLLRAIQKGPGRLLPVRASEADIHLNTAREHLRVLEDEGLIVSKAVQTGSRGRPPVVFYPVVDAASNPEATRRLTTAETRGTLIRRIAPELANDSGLSADARHQLDVLYEHLEDTGFEPHIDPETLKVDLVPCPHHGVVDQDQALVCSVHDQLVRDLLQQVPGPLELRRLRPFVSEHACIIALGSRVPEHSGDDEGHSTNHDQQPEPK